MNDFHSVVLMISALLALLAGLTFTVWVDPYISRDHRRTMLAVAAVILSLIAQNVFGYLLDVDGTKPYARMLVGIFGYSMRPVVLALLFFIVSPGKNRRWVWALVGVNALIHLTALFSGICFSIDAANRFHRGPLGYSCHIVSSVLLIHLLALTLREYRRERAIEALIPVFNAVIIILSVAVDSFVDYREYPVSYLTVAVVVGNVFFYIWLHLQFVREHEEALVAGQRMQLTLSQIKPHFLHNALTVIVDLCDTDPQKARQATVAFSKYLRGNMESLNENGAIPFARELEHTKLYLNIEKLRFGEDLQVRYDIGCTDFQLPALTVQPLAENAVRHGVREKPVGKGTVVIASRETPDGYEVTVTDDGPGFDPARPPEDGESHVGIANVRGRLHQISGGTLEYQIDPVVGTRAIIRIPKERKQD